jgi:radical SAM superfamily enzyme YgiQ (UPF0313 family)
MKVLLVHPLPPRTHWPRGSFRSRWVPTGLAFLATALRRAGHEVRVLVREEQLMKLDLDWQAADVQMRRLFAEYRPEWVGISVVTPLLPEAISISRLAKEICGPSTRVVLGGPHPTALPERTLEECPDAEAVVIGEGERTLVELAENGLSEGVRGIAYRGNGGILRTAARPFEHDLDALGPPALDLFDMAHFTARDRWMLRWLPLRAINIRTSRGCSNRCRFCAGTLVGGLGVRFHSVEYVVDRMAEALERYGVEAVHFEDDTMGADRDRLLALCDAIRRWGLDGKLKWDACLRADQADPERLRAMKEAGCIQVEYGFESGSDACLRRLGKATTVEMNLRAARLTREAGLRLFADIMLGLPGETADDLRSTARFLRAARPEIISYARLYPLPGTAIFNELPDRVRAGSHWAEFTYLDRSDFPVNITAMPDEYFEREYGKLVKYFFRPALQRQLLRDTPPGDPRRRDLARNVRRFTLRHPLRAARLP